MKKIILLMVAMCLLLAVSVSAVDVDACQLLDVAGETYTLTQDIEGSYDDSACIEIVEDDITLDCDGYSISSGDDNDLFLNGVEGTIVQSCSFLGANVEIEDSDENSFEDSTFDGEGDFSIGSNSENNEFYNNYFSMYINIDGASNIFYNNYFYNVDNVDLGINAEGTTTFSLITTIEAENIIGGNYIGGNYWADSEGNGFSETCDDINGDGFCDASYDVSGEGDVDEYVLTNNFDGGVSSCTTLDIEGQTLL